MRNARTAERLRGYVEHYGRIYPTAWEDAERFYKAKGSPGLGTWPEWCYVPMAGAAATVHGTSAARLGPGRAHPAALGYDTAVLAGLTAWRLGQGVYRFDPDLLGELWTTPIEGDIPGELLFRLPEYGVYVEAPEGVRHGPETLHGFFAHLEWDVNARRAELRMLLDTGEITDLTVLPLHLGGSLEEGFAQALRQTANLPAAVNVGLPTAPQEIQAGAAWLAELAGGAVSALLYLCSEAAEYGGGTVPGRARGPKLHRAPHRVTTWDVGERMGAALRRARQTEREGQGQGERQSPRGHMRRAHWHTFLAGPRDQERRRVLRWLPPIPVNLEGDDERPVNVRRVKR